jgi:hypothetical protein
VQILNGWLKVSHPLIAWALAFLSVLGLVVPIIVKAVTPNRSKTKADFLYLGSGDLRSKLYLLLTNSGNKPAAVAKAYLRPRMTDEEFCKELTIESPTQQTRAIPGGATVIFTLSLGEVDRGSTPELDPKDCAKLTEGRRVALSVVEFSQEEKLKTVAVSESAMAQLLENFTWQDTGEGLPGGAQ